MFSPMTNEAAVNASDAGQSPAAAADVVVRGDGTAFLQEISVGPYRLHADEPLSVGGTESAPDPYDYLMAGLGACTSMTVGLYARKRKWPLEDVTVALRRKRIHANDCADCETKDGMLDHIDLEVKMTGPLTEAQREMLMSIAQKCPVHRTLKSEIKITVRPADTEPTGTAAATK